MHAQYSLNMNLELKKNLLALNKSVRERYASATQDFFFNI